MALFNFIKQLLILNLLIIRALIIDTLSANYHSFQKSYEIPGILSFFIAQPWWLLNSTKFLPIWIRYDPFIIFSEYLNRLLKNVCNESI